tara:strand:- start:250 stop:393 length:144 start_codon:yes stop_codon:yes gene_type:complete
LAFLEISVTSESELAMMEKIRQILFQILQKSHQKESLAKLLAATAVL